MADNREEIYPDDNDILCGKSKACVNHTGSRRYREFIDSYRERYAASTTKYQKMVITKEIYNKLTSRRCRFLKFNKRPGTWEEISPAVARDKIGHALRFANQAAAAAAASATSSSASVGASRSASAVAQMSLSQSYASKDVARYSSYDHTNTEAPPPLQYRMRPTDHMAHYGHPRQEDPPYHTHHYHHPYAPPMEHESSVRRAGAWSAGSGEPHGHPFIRRSRAERSHHDRTSPIVSSRGLKDPPAAGEELPDTDDTGKSEDSPSHDGLPSKRGVESPSTAPMAGPSMIEDADIAGAETVSDEDGKRPEVANSLELKPAHKVAVNASPGDLSSSSGTGRKGSRVTARTGSPEAQAKILCNLDAIENTSEEGKDSKQKEEHRTSSRSSKRSGPPHFRPHSDVSDNVSSLLPHGASGSLQVSPVRVAARQDSDRVREGEPPVSRQKHYTSPRGGHRPATSAGSFDDIDTMMYEPVMEWEAGVPLESSPPQQDDSPGVSSSPPQQATFFKKGGRN